MRDYIRKIRLGIFRSVFVLFGILVVTGNFGCGMNRPSANNELSFYIDDIFIEQYGSSQSGGETFEYTLRIEGYSAQEFANLFCNEFGIEQIPRTNTADPTIRDFRGTPPFITLHISKGGHVTMKKNPESKVKETELRSFALKLFHG